MLAGSGEFVADRDTIGRLTELEDEGEGLGVEVREPLTQLEVERDHRLDLHRDQLELDRPELGGEEDGQAPGGADGLPVGPCLTQLEVEPAGRRRDGEPGSAGGRGRGSRPRARSKVSSAVATATTPTAST